MGKNGPQERVVVQIDGRAASDGWMMSRRVATVVYYICVHTTCVNEVVYSNAAWFIDRYCVTLSSSILDRPAGF